MAARHRLARSLLAGALIGALLQCAASLGGQAEAVDRWYAPLVPIL
ncbi:MAG: hypothetical protein ACR2GT_11010 [Gaiellaceae bacterium]